MRERNFGSLDRRHLTLRWSVSLAFQEWRDDGRGWRFAWRRLLSWRNWRGAIFGDNFAWDFWMRRHRDCTHRCYCPDGSSFDGTIAIAGFRLRWFYSHYRGDVPCWCDKVLDEMVDESIEESEAPHA